MEKLHKVCELGMAPEVYYLVNKMRQKLSVPKLLKIVGDFTTNLTSQLFFGGFFLATEVFFKKS